MPFDPDNPPEKIRKLSEKKQRQWVSVFNSCWKKHHSDEQCHKISWGVVGRSASDRRKLARELLRLAKNLLGE
jgi:hypothetical protein